MIMLCILMGVVRTTGDPTSNCVEWPGAAACDGDVAWDSLHSVCECRPLVQTFNQPSNHRVLQRIDRGKKRYHFDNCFRGQQRGKPKAMLIGILVDRSYYMSAGNNDESVKRVIYSLVNFGNKLFEEQFDIRLRVGTLYLAKEGHNIPSGKRGEKGQWMNDIRDWEGECRHIKDREGKGAIDYFSPWVDTISNDYAMWHLFTDCRGAGPGAAFLGLLGKSGRVAYSNWRPVTRHLTFTHETGHVFNGGHTFDEKRLNYKARTRKGIMDYGDGTFEGIIQFHPKHHKYMCSTINNSLAARDMKNVWAGDEKLPSACQCSADLLGNGACDANCDIEHCSFDFGDCDCPADLVPVLGNGKCDFEANTPQCKYDGGDCGAPPTTPLPTKPPSTTPTHTNTATPLPTTPPPTTPLPTTPLPTTPLPTTPLPTTPLPTTPLPTTPLPTTPLPTTPLPTKPPSTTPTHNPDTSTTKEDEGLDTGIIICIVFSIFVVLACLTIYFWRRSQVKSTGAQLISRAAPQDEVRTSRQKSKTADRGGKPKSRKVSKQADREGKRTPRQRSKSKHVKPRLNKQNRPAAQE